MDDEPTICRLADKYSVGTLNSLYYVPDFISRGEEQQLLQALKTSKAAWKEVSFPCISKDPENACPSVRAIESILADDCINELKQTMKLAVPRLDNSR